MFRLFNWNSDCALTYADKIDRYIKKHGSITALEASDKLRITVMHRTMTDMKRKGYKFSSVWERSDNNKRYRRYFIIARPTPCGNISK